jgi:hypothetical protein
VHDDTDADQSPQNEMVLVIRSAVVAGYLTHGRGV